ncbi:uncharacterized protein VTP21DRAFT_4122 [Calcarisporiella thermophila]|uniref:uncharacterized protein n=1 Tax=Calcarisporiella thermophila TaxID=911321 RepID=UPI003742DCFA
MTVLSGKAVKAPTWARGISQLKRQGWQIMGSGLPVQVWGASRGVFQGRSGPCGHAQSEAPCTGGWRLVNLKVLFDSIRERNITSLLGSYVWLANNEVDGPIISDMLSAFGFKVYCQGPAECARCAVEQVLILGCEIVVDPCRTAVASALMQTCSSPELLFSITTLPTSNRTVSNAYNYPTNNCVVDNTLIHCKSQYSSDSVSLAAYMSTLKTIADILKRDYATPIPELEAYSGDKGCHSPGPMTHAEARKVLAWFRAQEEANMDEPVSPEVKKLLEPPTSPSAIDCDFMCLVVVGDEAWLDTWVNQGMGPESAVKNFITMRRFHSECRGSECSDPDTRENMNDYRRRSHRMTVLSGQAVKAPAWACGEPQLERQGWQITGAGLPVQVWGASRGVLQGRSRPCGHAQSETPCTGGWRLVDLEVLSDSIKERNLSALLGSYVWLANDEVDGPLISDMLSAFGFKVYCQGLAECARCAVEQALRLGCEIVVDPCRTSVASALI